jgi:hypothetical protein
MCVEKLLTAVFENGGRDLSSSEPQATFKIHLSPQRIASATPVFNTYWRFAESRQKLFFRRLSGSPPPWTDDPILPKHRFTNVYRASDRVSQYLIRHVIYEGDQSANEIFFRAVLFRFFNRIQTWERLKASVGEISWRTFELPPYQQVLDNALASGERVYSAAYIMPTPRFGAVRKHTNHLLLLKHMMQDDAPSKIADASSLESVFKFLRTYPSLGDFLAFQLAIDLNYSGLIDFSEMDFVVAGPGARNGIKKCFADTAGLTEVDVIRAMAEIADRQFRSLDLQFSTLWGRPLQLIDCQNLFCEVDKYARVAHPEIRADTARSRIKQRFRPTTTPLPQWYPPKWKLEPVCESLTQSGPATVPRNSKNDSKESSLPLFPDEF